MFLYEPCTSLLHHDSVVFRFSVASWDGASLPDRGVEVGSLTGHVFPLLLNKTSMAALANARASSMVD